MRSHLGAVLLVSVVSVPGLAGVIDTVAGTGKKGYSGDGGPATAALLNEPFHCDLNGKGALFIGAHLCNLELTRALAAGGRKAAVNAVIYVEHGRSLFDTLARANPDFSVNLIHVAEVGPGTSIELKEKIDRGELLVIVGDRTPPGERGRTCTVDFLGAPAPFAKGPFILAALLECPVYLFFCLKEADGYRIHFERFDERVVLPRAEREARLQELLQRYAHRLEAYCLRAPYQWFNFYDYWGKRSRDEIRERKAA
jgi:predicted LPLAT superfamily acyltransferase